MGHTGEGMPRVRDAVWLGGYLGCWPLVDWLVGCIIRYLIPAGGQGSEGGVAGEMSRTGREGGRGEGMDRAEIMGLIM